MEALQQAAETSCFPTQPQSRRGCSRRPGSRRGGPQCREPTHISGRWYSPRSCTLRRRSAARTAPGSPRSAGLRRPPAGAHSAFGQVRQGSPVPRGHLRRPAGPSGRFGDRPLVAVARPAAPARRARTTCTQGDSSCGSGPGVRHHALAVTGDDRLGPARCTLHLRSASPRRDFCPSARQESQQRQALSRCPAPCRSPRSDRYCNGGANVRQRD